MQTKEIIYKGKARTVEFHTVYASEFLAEQSQEWLETQENRAGLSLACWLKMPKPRKHTISQHLATYANLKQTHNELMDELISRKETN